MLNLQGLSWQGAGACTVEDNKLKNCSQQIISAVCSVIVNEEFMITVLYAAFKIQYILEAGVRRCGGDVPIDVTTIFYGD